jgi:hypothetical protein
VRDWRRASNATTAPSAARTPVRPSSRPAAAPGDRLAHGGIDPDQLLELQRLAGNDAASGLVAQRQEASGDAVYEEAEREQAAASADERAIAEGEAAIEAAGDGPLAWRALPAELDGEAMFVLFDSVPVQKLFQALLRRWGLSGPSHENTAGLETAPPWVGDFRARALNVRPNASYEGAEEDARLARLASRLADSVATETPAQNARRTFVTEIQGRIGTAVMSQAAIDAERAKPAGDGYTPANFTTCIAFFGQVMGQVSARLGLPATTVKGPNAYKEINSEAKESLGDRWTPLSGGGRPKPGDLLIFTFNQDEKNQDGSIKYGEGWFAHISILRAIEPMPDGPNGAQERWISVDGGGTTAKEVVRVFHPATGLIVGPANVTRTMKGWIDIEKAVEAGLVPRR